MNQIFLELLNNAVVSSVLIIVVLLIRICIKKAPKWITCVLWGMVAIKLVLPFRIESVLSLIPSSKLVPVEMEYQSAPQVTTGVTAMNDVVNPVLASDFASNGVASVSPMQMVISVLSVLWVMGMVILCIYFVVSYCLLRKRVALSKNILENVYACDAVNSPFILGIIRPRIYLPSGMDQDTLECVLAHEKAHLRRLDHIWKPFGFLVLTLYWFNPLCWISYVLLCKDIEFACDELVMKDKDKEWKITYCQALLDCSIKRKAIAACPIAFGEVSVKDRVRSVLHYKKPAFWIVVVAVLSCAVVAVCFMTSPKSDADVADNNQLTMQELVSLVTSKSWNQIQEEEGIAFWDDYNNLLEDETFHKDSLTSLRSVQFDYGGAQFEFQVYYWPEDTAKKEKCSVGELDMICLSNVKTNDAILLYSRDKSFTVNTDIESFLAKKYELPEEILKGNECKALNGKISYSEYNVDLCLNFAGCLFENSNYREPSHGEWTSRAWYSLGGVGICNDSNYESLEKFENGKLVRYSYTDNHMSGDFIQTFNVGEYSGCLYKYNVDLVTATETDLLKDAESAKSEYWVAFFTKGQGEPLYMKFFNCDYYSQKDALESVASGV